MLNPTTTITGPIGTVTQFNAARRPADPARTRYFGRHATSGATGPARLTHEEAAADVLAWQAGRSPGYERHAELPAGYTDRLLARRRYNANCVLVP